MSAPLVNIEIPSIYFDSHNNRKNYPRVFNAHPICAGPRYIERPRSAGRQLFLSDMFRGFDIRPGSIDNMQERVFSLIPADRTNKRCWLIWRKNSCRLNPHQCIGMQQRQKNRIQLRNSSS